MTGSEPASAMPPQSGGAPRRLSMGRLYAYLEQFDHAWSRVQRVNVRGYWSEAGWLGVAFVLGALVRFIVAAYGGSVSHDAAAYYLPNARAFVEGVDTHWQAIAVPFIFPRLVASLHSIVGDYEYAALAVSILSAAAMVFPIYGLCRLYFPGWASIHRLGMLIAVVHPFSVRFGGDAKADAFYALLFTLAFWAGVSALVRPRLWVGAVFGALVGLAYLVRPEALGLAGLEVIAAAFLAWRWASRPSETLLGDGPGYGRRILATAVVAVFCLAPLIAWNMVVVHERVGRWTLSPKAGVLQDISQGAGATLLKLNESGDKTVQEERLTSSAGYQSFSPVELFLRDPATKLKAYGKNLYEYVRVFPPALGSCIAVFWLVGLVLGWRQTQSWVRWIVGGLFVFYGLSYAPFYMSRRFWLALVPACLPFAAAGVHYAILELHRWKRVPPGVVVVLMVLTCLPEGMNQSFKHDFRWFGSVQRDLGRELADLHPDSAPTIVSSKGQVTWYAGGDHLPIPVAPLPEVLRYMELREASFLVIDQGRTKRRQRDFWDAIQQSPQLERVAEANGKDAQLIVYRLRPKLR